jgi:(R,R)-butanediol dehydrogenase/meso-butanediol dehydrogenase/diacetyl reductase/L-iditol 2-dehydrogenase
MVDINNYRLDTAIEMGASLGLNNRKVDVLQEISNFTSDLGVDRSFEAVGIEATLLQALRVLKNGGIATLVGLFEQPAVNLPANLIVQKEISLIGSQGYCWDFQTAIRFAAQKRVDLMPLVTHQIPFDQVQEAFEILSDPNSNAIKIAILME